MDNAARTRLVRNLLKWAGTSYAKEAGIRLKDTPMPLFQLLTLCMLANKPIDATGAKLAAALVRVSLDDELRDKVASPR